MWNLPHKIVLPFAFTKFVEVFSKVLLHNLSLFGWILIWLSHQEFFLLSNRWGRWHHMVIVLVFSIITVVIWIVFNAYPWIASSNLVLTSDSKWWVFLDINLWEHRALSWCSLRLVYGPLRHVLLLLIWSITFVLFFSIWWISVLTFIFFIHSLRR